MPIPIEFLDGGLGTTLTDVFNFDLSHHVPQEAEHLWSGSLLLTPEGKKILQSTHEAFLDAGCDVIETATYQLSKPSLVALMDEERAQNILQDAIEVAVKATKNRKNKKIAISLGPLGALLVPGAEYSGIYPPPYGVSLQVQPHNFPIGTDKFFVLAAEQHQALQDLYTADINSETRSLTNFHYRRLIDLYPTMDKVQYIAFETIPTPTEAFAISHAMEAFNQTHNINIKWWISLVFPSEPNDKDNALQDNLKHIIRILFDLKLKTRPWGIGLNCTKISKVDSILNSFHDALSTVKYKPWLVLYPDGGAVYDVRTKSWISKPMDHEEWAEKMEDIVMRQTSRDCWSGILVGGCCRTTPSNIEAIRTLLK